MNTQEIWRDVPGYNGKYRVSNKERFINTNYKSTGASRLYEKSDMIQPSKNSPYYKVSLTSKHIGLHELVAKSFPDICGNYFPGCAVHHINGNKQDNRPENLKVLSVKEHRMLHPVDDSYKEMMRHRNSGANNPFYGRHHSDEQKKKWSKERKGRLVWNKGKTMDDEYRKKNSEAHNGLQAGEKNGMFGRHRSERVKSILRAAHSKPICQYTIDGTFIAEWPSIKIAEVTLGIYNIGKCANGVARSAGGYVWKFKHTNSES